MVDMPTKPNYIYSIYMYKNRTIPNIGMMVRVSPMAQETGIQSQVESYQRLKKWYLMPPYLTLRIIRYGSRVKWSNPGKGVAPSPTPWCSSYRKGSLRLWSPIYMYKEDLALNNVKGLICHKNQPNLIIFTFFVKNFFFTWSNRIRIILK